MTKETRKKNNEHNEKDTAVDRSAHCFVLFFFSDFIQRYIAIKFSDDIRKLVTSQILKQVHIFNRFEQLYTQ